MTFEYGSFVDSSLVDFILTVVRMASPLVLAMYAGLFSERSGVVNIALEGLLLFGAFFAAAAAFYAGSPWIGLLAGGLAGGLVAWIYALVTVVRQSDQIVAGTAINMLAWGGIPFMSFVFFGSSANTPSLEMADRLPEMMPHVLVICASIVVFYVFYASKFGLYLTFAGEKPSVLADVGVKLVRVRIWSLITGGFFAGLGGALLSICLASAFTRNMTSGRGFMALAALILGKWHPGLGLLAALLFGVAEFAQISLQGTSIAGVSVPLQLVQGLPYLLTLVLLAGMIGKSRAPKALGQP